MSIHLPGRRRLRSPKLKITSRKKGKKAEAVAPAPAPEPPVPDPEPPAPEPDPEPSSSSEDGASEWSPDDSKDELVAVAQQLGVYDDIEGTGANGNVLKEDIVKALEAASTS